MDQLIGSYEKKTTNRPPLYVVPLIERIRHNWLIIFVSFIIGLISPVAIILKMDNTETKIETRTVFIYIPIPINVEKVLTKDCKSVENTIQRKEHVVVVIQKPTNNVLSSKPVKEISEPNDPLLRRK